MPIVPTAAAFMSLILSKEPSKTSLLFVRAQQPVEHGDYGQGRVLHTRPGGVREQQQYLELL
jgi:hypothetical protein